MVEVVAVDHDPFTETQGNLVPVEGNPFAGNDLGRTAAALQGFNGAVPFGNRIAAGLGAAGAATLTGDSDISALYNEARASQKATSQEHPNYELAGTVLGIANSIPLAIGKSGGGGTLGGIGDAVTGAASKVGNFVRGGGSKLANMARGSTVAAGASGLYGYGASDNPLDSAAALDDAATSASLGAGVGIALPGAGAALGALSPRIDSGLQNIAQIARKHDIPLSFDQISSSRSLKTAQKISQELPFSGQAGFRDKQMSAYNRALFKTIGVDADKFTPETMNAAFGKVGGEFDNVTKGKTFNIGGDFVDNVAQTLDEVASTYGDEAAGIYQREALKVIDDFSQGDNISGELISRQRSRINQLARNTPNPSIKGALLDLENNIVDGITSGDPAAQAALSQAKQRYKNLIVLEPLAAKAKGGNISPTLLNNRVSQVYKRAHTVGNSGDIGDLARIGHELLPELGGSDTAQKVMMMKAAAYPSALIAGATSGAAVPAAAGAALGAGANRLVQSGLNRNQNVIDRVLQQRGISMPDLMQLPPAQVLQLLNGNTP